MSDLEKIVYGILDTMGIAILVQLKDKVIAVSPKILKNLNTNDVIQVRIDSIENEEDLIEILEILDETKST